jgi:hypothetical protein
MNAIESGLFIKNEGGRRGAFLGPLFYFCMVILYITSNRTWMK